MHEDGDGNRSGRRIAPKILREPENCRFDILRGKGRSTLRIAMQVPRHLLLRRGFEALIESRGLDSARPDVEAQYFHEGLRLLHRVAAELVAHDGEHFVAKRISHTR